MTAREFYIWRVEGCTVRLSLDVVQKLNHNLSDPRMKANEEQGGILFGSIRDGVPEISGFEFFPSEHKRGIVYDLSARERSRVARYVASRMKGHGAKPLGYFRTHLRPGLFLDQDDFALMWESFAEPTAIALLVRPESDGRRSGGFFFWQDGDIDRRQSHLQFPFDAQFLAPHAVALPPVPRRVWAFPKVSPRWGWAAAAAIVVPAIAAVVVLNRQPWDSGKASAPVVAVHVPAAPGPSLPSAIPDPPRAGELEAPATAPDQPDTRIEAPAAVFEDGDGDPPDEPRHVAAVRTTPPPVRVAGTPVPKTSTPQMVAKSIPAPVPASPAPVASPPVQPPQQPAAAPPAAENKPVAAPQPKEHGVLVAVSIEPRLDKGDSGSSILKAVGHVPILGHPFRRNKEADQTFVAARPERGLTPRIPRHLAEDLSHELPVDVRLWISGEGKVTSSEVLSGAGSGFAALAADSASAAPWSPARLGDRQVASELIVHFRFRPALD